MNYHKDMTAIEERLYEQLIVKSQEAFIMAIELYNKPTIKYRVEGFAFFICNAWELMLKAKILKDKGESAIYYKDNPERTINLENCLKVLFTNERDPLRRNLEKIVDLRNTSTHFITQEYEMLYVPLFQACAYNYADKLSEFHNIDISKQIPSHFINLSVSVSSILDSDIKSKYSQTVYNKLMKTQGNLTEAINSEGSERFAIVSHQDLRLTKKGGPDIPSFRIAKQDEESDGNVTIIKEIQNPNNTHPYNVKNLIVQVNKQLKRREIPLNFTQGNFRDFNKYFGFKEQPEFCFVHENNAKPTFSYSQRTIDFIVNEIVKDPEICMVIRGRLKEKKS